MVFDLIHHGDLADGNISDFLFFIPQIQHAAFYINDIAAKRRVCAARNIDLFAKQLF